MDLERVQAIQLNAQKCEVAHYQLVQKLNDLGSYVCFLQEPYKYKGKLANVPVNATAIPSKEVEGGPRAAIIASSNIGIIEVNALSHRDCAVGIIPGRDGNQAILVASVYLDITRPVAQKFFYRPAAIY